MPRYHNTNGVHIQFTAEEEAARDAEEKLEKLEKEMQKYKKIYG